MPPAHPPPRHLVGADDASIPERKQPQQPQELHRGREGTQAPVDKGSPARTNASLPVSARLQLSFDAVGASACRTPPG
eukprot:13541255-Alexandrium_andersonii.AAC.1